MQMFQQIRIPRPVILLIGAAVFTLLPWLAVAAETDSQEIAWMTMGMNLFGGLAIFLFGMEQMTDALKIAAGDRMKNLLARLTTNRFKAVFAGAWFTPGKNRVVPADLSAHKKLSFWAKGKPAKHSVMIFAADLPYSRSTKRFEVTEKWTQFTYDIAEFDGCDGKNVFGFWFGGPVA